MCEVGPMRTFRAVRWRVTALGWIGLGWAAAVFAAPGQAAVAAIFPLEEVRPGMRGVWRTVVSGTEVAEFPLEVVGLAPNFVGPQRTIIICRAVDPVNLESGPVAGMSGSPVYIDGRLVGAYAYGFTWPKNQAIIGVTPAADMLEVLGFADEGPAWAAGSGGSAGNRHGVGMAGGIAERPVQLDGGAVEGLPEMGVVPMLAGGFSPRTLAVFGADWRAMGVEPQVAPAGSAEGPGEEHLQPGGAIAGVLMSGDFSFAGTGTVTWREGDRLLGFGHPFFSFGQAEIPMATAEILTVIQSVPRSFKLSRHGPIVGTITQDRLSAIAGTVGPVPEQTRLAIAVTPAAGPQRTFSAQVFRHPRLTPLLVGMGVMQALDSTQEVIERSTVVVRSRVEIAGFGRVDFHQAATGSGGLANLAREWQRRLHTLLDNPFEPAIVDAIEIEAVVVPGWKATTLRAVQVANTRVRAGEDLHVEVTVGREREEPLRWPVRLPVPADVRPGEKLTLLLADAETAASVVDGTEAPVTSVADIVARWRAARAPDRLYALLLRAAPGVQAEGVSLPDLPPSVRATLMAERTRMVRRELSDAVLAEAALDLAGPFEGRYRLELTVDP